MKESKFIGTLMPSHPDFQTIIQAMREKYQLPEVEPDGEPTASDDKCHRFLFSISSPLDSAITRE